MCLVSDKIKFCTCSVGKYYKLPHYWLLYRLNHNEERMEYMGEPIMPQMHLNLEINNKTLLKRINEADAFDKEMSFKKDDQLEVVINNLGDEFNRMSFCFKYKKGKWRDEDYDTFGVEDNYDKVAFGDFKEMTEE